MLSSISVLLLYFLLLVVVNGSNPNRFIRGHPWILRLLLAQLTNNIGTLKGIHLVKFPDLDCERCLGCTNSNFLCSSILLSTGISVPFRFPVIKSVCRKKVILSLHILCPLTQSVIQGLIFIIVFLMYWKPISEVFSFSPRLYIWAYLFTNFQVYSFSGSTLELWFVCKWCQWI